jgi:O-6-methylguanine DNA methyltransferase
MVRVTAGERNDTWYGVAWADDGLVATATGVTHDAALVNVRRCLPAGVQSEPTGASDDLPGEITRVIAMLDRLEHGDESDKRFRLSTYVSIPLRRILTAAAAIPIGYVTTYGDIAVAAGSEARPVGRVMATNPLYPIVPCHRVVGSDFALVGYGGRQDEKALEAKLKRLRAEAGGAVLQRDITLALATREIAGLPPDATPLGPLLVSPVEWVIEAAEEHRARRVAAAAEAAARKQAERQQLKLF